MLMLKAFVAFTVPLEAFTVKLNNPRAVGVPEMTPLEGRLNPFGKNPSASDQTTPAPVAVSVALYGLPTSPSGKDDVVITMTGESTVRVAALEVALPESLLAMQRN